MKYMQNGAHQKNPMMQLTLWFTLLLLTAFVGTNFFLYLSKMNFAPASVISYYNGSEEEFRPPRSYQSMLEVTHGHLAMMAMVLLFLTHLVLFAPYSRRKKILIISIAFLSALFNEASGWLVRFVHPQFALLKIISFLSLQSSLICLIVALGIFLLHSAKDGEAFSSNGKARRDPENEFDDALRHHKSEPHR